MSWAPAAGTCLATLPGCAKMPDTSIPSPLAAGATRTGRAAQRLCVAGHRAPSAPPGHTALRVHRQARQHRAPRLAPASPQDGAAGGAWRGGGQWERCRRCCTRRGQTQAPEAQDRAQEELRAGPVPRHAAGWRLGACSTAMPPAQGRPGSTAQAAARSSCSSPPRATRRSRAATRRAGTAPACGCRRRAGGLTLGARCAGHQPAVRQAEQRPESAPHRAGHVSLCVCAWSPHSRCRAEQAARRFKSEGPGMDESVHAALRAVRRMPLRAMRRPAALRWTLTVAWCSAGLQAPGRGRALCALAAGWCWCARRCSCTRPAPHSRTCTPPGRHVRTSRWRCGQPACCGADGNEPAIGLSLESAWKAGICKRSEVHITSKLWCGPCAGTCSCRRLLGTASSCALLAHRTRLQVPIVQEHGARQARRQARAAAEPEGLEAGLPRSLPGALKIQVVERHPHLVLRDTSTPAACRRPAASWMWLASSLSAWRQCYCC